MGDTQDDRIILGFGGGGRAEADEGFEQSAIAIIEDQIGGVIAGGLQLAGEMTDEFNAGGGLGGEEPEQAVGLDGPDDGGDDGDEAPAVGGHAGQGGGSEEIAGAENFKKPAIAFRADLVDADLSLLDKKDSIGCFGWFAQHGAGGNFLASGFQGRVGKQVEDGRAGNGGEIGGVVHEGETPAESL